MLFSGGGPTNKPKREERRERKADRGEWAGAASRAPDDKYEVQEAVFTRWANSLFNDPITELREVMELDFLHAFCKLITGKTLSTTGNKYDDADAVLHALATDEDDRILQLSIPELYDGNVKQLLTLCNCFMNLYWRRHVPQEMKDMKISEAIRDWCLEATAGYDDVCVNDFTSSWRDGMALNILLHSYDPNLVDMNSVRDMRGDERLENALNTAKKVFKVQKLILPKEFHSEHLDTKSVLCYLMSLYTAMATHSNSQSSSSRKSTKSAGDAPKQDERDVLMPPREPTIAEVSPSTSVQSSTHSSAPSSATNITVIHRPELDMQQSMETISDPVEAETTSRHSSVSSQRPSPKNSRTRKNESIVKEYERCLEKVLAWLLEAEEELNAMEPVHQTDVDVVKTQFRDHEQFMLSLTESKDKVGRVLHEGQNLVESLPEDQAKSVTDQLVLVNQRWEDVRCQAMLRQQSLQTQLDRLQKEQLGQIRDWLSEIEAVIAEKKALPNSVDACRKEIEDHTALEDQIDKQQNAVKKLSSYMAVVGEKNSDEEDYNRVEGTLKEVGERWDRVCNWVERRAKNLDGICDLLQEYENKYTHLSAWLTARQEELVRLKSAHHLKSGAEVDEQKKLIEEVEQALHREHPAFIELSQLSTDLRDRYKMDNQEFTDEINKRFDSVTQRWENIVSRLEEHSQMLSRLHFKSQSRSVSLESSNKDREQSKEIESDAGSSRKHSEQTQNLVELFVEKASSLESSLKPINDYLKALKNPTKQQFAAIEKDFKEKFRAVIEAKSQVDQLDHLISKVHESSINSDELHDVNTSYDRVMLVYSTLVTKFTDIIHYINNPDMVRSDEAKIHTHLTDWIDSANAVWAEISALPQAARGHRLEDFIIQLNELQKKFSEFKAANENTEQFRPLENRLIELQQKVRREKEKEEKECEKNVAETKLEADKAQPEQEPMDVPKALNWIREKISEIHRTQLDQGDLDQLHGVEDMLRDISSEVRNKLEHITDDDFVTETEKLVALIKAKKDEADGMINHAETVVHKCVRVEEMADDTERKLGNLKRSEESLQSIENESRKLRDEFLLNLPHKKEAHNMVDELLKSGDKAPTGRAVQQWRDRLRKLDQQWSQLEIDLDEYISLVAREYRKQFQAVAHEQEVLAKELKEALAASGEATDAEELSENVDNLEMLLEKMTKGSDGADPMAPYQGVKDAFIQSEVERVNQQRAETVDIAKERVVRLQQAISRCERFDQELNAFQQWCQRMHQLLDARLSSDIDALDVPHEYKKASDQGILLDKMSAEFGQYEDLLREMGEFIEESQSHWRSSGRLKVQKAHADEQLRELRDKFDKFKKPIQFDKQMDSVEKALSVVEESLDDLTGLKAENCAYAQIHMNQLGKQVATCQEEVLEMEAKKDGFIREGMFDEEQAVSVTKRLESAAEKAENLAGRVDVTSDRLTECAELLTKFIAEKDETAKLLDELEQETKPKLKDMEGKLKKAHSGIRKTKELMQLLKGNGIKMDESEIALQTSRFSNLKKKHGIELEEKSSPEREKKEDIPAIVDSVKRLLSSLEKHKDPLALKEKLDKSKSIKAKLDDATQTVLTAPPEDRVLLGPQLAELNSRWAALEKLARPTPQPEKERSAELSAPNSPAVLPAVAHCGELTDDNFEKAVDDFYKAAKVVDDFLNFELFPPSSKEDWAARLRKAQRFCVENEKRRDELVKFGRVWAEKGRMELAEQKVLDTLDAADVQIAKSAAQIKVEQLHFEQFEKHETIVRNCISVNEELLDRVVGTDLNEHNALLNVQRSLQSVGEDLVATSALIDQFEDKVKGREQVCQGLRDELAQLQAREEAENDRVRNVLNTILTETGDESDNEEEEGQVGARKLIPPDGVSMSSGAGLSLAMDVHETEGEDYASDKQHSAPKTDLRQVFADLDGFEDFFDTDESLPFEGLDKKAEFLQLMEDKLNEDEDVLRAREMTTDINEFQHNTNRVEALRASIMQRAQSIACNKNTIDSLFALFQKAESGVAELGNSLSGEGPSRRETQSINLVDWEAGQLMNENFIASVAMHIHQCENRLAEVRDQLSAALSQDLGGRLANMEQDFHTYRSEVSKNRAALEDQLADENYLLKNMEAFASWCDEKDVLMRMTGTFLDPVGLDDMHEMFVQVQVEADDKLHQFRNLENLKDRFVAFSNADSDVKHHFRREITQLGKRISDTIKELASLKESSDDFWSELNRANQWVEDAERQVEGVENAQLYQPSLLNLKKIVTDSSDIKLLLDTIQRQVATEMLELDVRPDAIHQSEKSVEYVVKRFHKVVEKARNLLDRPDPTVVHQREDREETIASAPSMKADDSTEYGTLTTKDGSIPRSTEETVRRGHFEMICDALDQPLTGNESRRQVFEIPDIPAQERPYMDKCIQIQNRLHEIERSAAATVDMADHVKIRQLMSVLQNLMDELGVHKLELQALLDKTDDQEVASHGIQCLHDLKTIADSCNTRKTELTQMLHHSKLWEQLRAEVELFLTDGNQQLHTSQSVNELDEFALDLELKAVMTMAEQVDHIKEQIGQMNDKSNFLIDHFQLDDSHSISQQTSRLNTQWTKFNEGMVIRRAMLEASLRSRNDIQTTLSQLDDWMDKQLDRLKQLHSDTENKQRLKDTSKRRDWMAVEREIKAEVDAHEQVMGAVREMCKKMMSVLEAEKEKLAMSKKFEVVENKWRQIRDYCEVVRERLKSAQDECERLTKDLSELLHWTDMQISCILHDQPVGGDLTTVQRQTETVQQIEKQLDVKNREVADCIQLAHSYLMQHDLRPMMHKSSVLDSAKDLEKSEVELEERRVGVQILADSEKLKSTYESLKQHLAAWQRVVSTAYKDIQELDTAIAESLLSIGAIEADLEAMRLVEQLRLEELKQARVEHARLKKQVQDAGVKVDDVNDCCGQIAAQNIVLSEQMEAQVRAVNERFEGLKRAAAVRGAALERAFADFGPSSEHFLADSVHPPWQRAISALNQMPYYVDHTTEHTQWDHPNMVEIFEKLCTFNQVKFSAYRTAMKLRALQKHMCLDLIDLPSLDEALHRFRQRPLDEKINVDDVVMCLVPLFEKAHNRYPQLLRNVPLAVDLALNLLLNIYDPCRDGKLRTTSFAIALVVLCNASLESKYKFLFSLITRDGGVDHKQLALLFYDLIHITKLLGEAAVFGGSNVEPSVRSCFEFNKYPAQLHVDGYLAWLKKEPQSLVWLPVMHRLASSEFAKHQSKCNACKMFPIVGMRYRCLRCFNYDICQNCFFSQRTSKSHKLTHPMQEYCTPTNPKDDVRDFTLMVKNKMRRSRSKVGYLPVDTVHEGIPLEHGQVAPQNPATEVMHQRMQIISQRLAKRQQESLNATNVQKALMLKDETKVVSLKDGSPTRPRIHKSATEDPALRGNDVKSPSQLIKQVEQMHKEEMDQLLQKLQFENSELKEAVQRRRRMGSTPCLEAGGMRQSGPGELAAGLGAARTQPGIYASAQTMPHHPGLRAHSAAVFGASPPSQRIASQPALFSDELRSRHYGRSASSLPRGYSEVEAFAADQRRLLDAKSMRLHEHQLEERSRALEEQNKQLQIQLERLQKLVDKKKSDEFIHRPLEMPQGGADFALRKPDAEAAAYGVSSTDEDEIPGGIESLKMRRNRMDTLMNTMNELNRAMETFVGSVVNEDPVKTDVETEPDTS